MHPLRLGSSFFILSYLLTACTTLSQEQCESRDWYKFGFVDGSRGHTAEQINKHKEACADYKITPNVHEYEQGRLAGLKLMYCTESSGKKEGEANKIYYSVCPLETEPNFLSGYLSGLQTHRDDLERDLSIAQEEERSAARDIYSATNDKDRQKAETAESSAQSDISTIRNNISNTQELIGEVQTYVYVKSKQNKAFQWSNLSEIESKRPLFEQMFGEVWRDMSENAKPLNEEELRPN